MTNHHYLEATREYLKQWFLNQHRSSNWDPVESILINDGCYCGRKFIFGPYRAIWFVEENQIKIFAPDGTVTATQDCQQLLEQHLQAESQQRRAA